MPGGYGNGQHRHGTFPSLQKALLGSAVPEPCLRVAATTVHMASAGTRGASGFSASAISYLSKSLDLPDLRTSSELYLTTLNLCLLSLLWNRVLSELKDFIPS